MTDYMANQDIYNNANQKNYKQNGITAHSRFFLPLIGLF